MTTNLGIIGYLPPPDVKMNVEAFLGNLANMRPSRKVVFLSDYAKWDVSEIGELYRTIPFSQIPKSHPFVLHNAAFLTCVAAAVQSGIKYFIYLEPDCRFMRPRWDDEIFEKAFDGGDGFTMAGTLAFQNATEMPGDLLECYHRAIASNTEKNFPVASYVLKNPPTEDNLPRYCAFVNGALSVVNVSEVKRLIGSGRIGEMSQKIPAWDIHIGRKVTSECGCRFGEKLKPISCIYSGHSLSTNINEVSVIQAAKVWKFAAIHQIKSNWQPELSFDMGRLHAPAGNARFTISILSMASVEMSKRCIANVVANSEPGTYRLILTSNGNPEIARFFKSLDGPNVEVVVNESNLGFVDPNRVAFSKCKTEFFVMLNDDALVPNGWLNEFKKAFDEDPNLAIAGPNNTCCSFVSASDLNGTKTDRIDYVEASCMCLKTLIGRSVGFFSDYINFAYCEDSDLSMKVVEAGYNLKLANFGIQHNTSSTSKMIPGIKAIQLSNYSAMKKRWAPYLKFRTMEYRTLIRRSGAMGDVVLLTAAVAALKKEKPKTRILIETPFSDIFLGNPAVVGADRDLGCLAKDSHFIDLDMSYENEVTKPYSKVYADRLGVRDFPNITSIHLTNQESKNAKNILRPILIGKPRMICAIHAGPSWDGRDWPVERFEELAQVIMSNGIAVVCVGVKKGIRKISCSLDLCGDLTRRETAAVLSRVSFFVGIDSGPIHLAQAVGTPVLGLFGMTDPKMVLTNGSLWKAVVSTHPDFGLRHRIPGKNYVPCNRAVMDQITVSQTIKKLEELICDLGERW